MNVIYLHTHDTGRIISPYGYAVETPNLQAFCNDAVLFQNSYCVAPTCSPSRSGLLTGLYPHQNGMLGLAQRGFSIDKNKHLASILRGHGFHCTICGVQHEVGYYTDHQLACDALGYEEDISTPNDSYSEKDLVTWDAENAKSLVNWLENYRDNRPFFVSFGQHATHREWPDAKNEPKDYARPPVNIPNNETTRTDYARYKTAVRMADCNFGLVLDALRKTGLYENTIILVTTDHGLAYPFEKCSLTDAGTGVFMIMRVPNSKYKNRSYEGLVSQIDIMPTLLDLLGLAKPSYLEGTSHAQIFKGVEDQGDEAIFSEINFHTSYEPCRSVRTKRYLYIRYFDGTWLKNNLSNIDGSEVRDWYLEHGLAERNKDLECLYDTYYDVFETNNVANNPDYHEVLVQMREQLKSFMQSTDDPLLNGPIPIKDNWIINKIECLNARSKDPSDYVDPTKQNQ